MPLSTAVVGATTPSIKHSVDARWLMAYAASLNDLNPKYMDTQAASVIAHPVFPVCVEWPVILCTRDLFGVETLTAEESARGVHAAHDLHLHKPITAGDELVTQATMIGVTSIKPGAAYTMRLDTRNQAEELVARTYQLGICRGVATAGADNTEEQPPALPPRSDPSLGNSHVIHVPAGAAHTYTECAHIWNPIHTDREVALKAGLPDIILHGTATLALAVTDIVNQFCAGDPSRVVRLGGRFSAMVLMPSDISVQAHRVDNVVSYHVLTENGQPAISNGFVCLD